MQQVAVPGGHEKGLEELAVGGDVLEDAPPRPSEATAHDPQPGHGLEESIGVLLADSVLDEYQDGTVVGMDVVAYGERGVDDELKRGAIHDRQAKAWIERIPGTKASATTNRVSRKGRNVSMMPKPSPPNTKGPCITT